MLGIRKRIVIYKGWKILNLHANCEQQATIGTIKSAPKIPPHTMVLYQFKVNRASH